MGKSFSQGLAVSDSTIVRKERILPLKGEVKVKKGDKVTADQIVAVTMLPGKVVPINLANKLGVTPNLIEQYLKVKEGDQITKGHILAQTNGILGMFKTTVRSPTEGEVQSISRHTGQVLLNEPRIPVEVKAFIDGVVVEVIPEQGVIIENKSAYIQGIFGIGGEINAEIDVVAKAADEVVTADRINENHKGKIIVTGEMLHYDAIMKAVKVGVKGIITGGIHDQDLKKLLGYDIGVAITGHEDVGLTIVVTEGFGPIKMANKTFDLLKSFQGSKVSMHGFTQIRAGVIRPEIIKPIKFKEDELIKPESELPMIEVGKIIRVIRQPNFGKIGKVIAMPEELTMVESETLVRVLKAELETGETVLLPRANVEIISE